MNTQIINSNSDGIDIDFEGASLEFDDHSDHGDGFTAEMDDDAIATRRPSLPPPPPAQLPRREESLDGARLDAVSETPRCRRSLPPSFKADGEEVSPKPSLPEPTLARKNEG